MTAFLAHLLRYIADALDPPPSVNLALSNARQEYERCVRAHRGQRAAYAKFRTALHEALRRELGI